MTFSLDMGQVVAAVAGVVVLNAIATGVGSLIFRARAGEWHKENQNRLGRIEKALGIDDPDSTAFLRRSEAEDMAEAHRAEHERIWGKVNEHDRRIFNLE